MIRATAALSALLCALLPAQSTEKLVGGPYVVNVSPGEATIAWVLESRDSERPFDVQKITLRGLQPGRTYHYDVLGRDEGKGSFKTAPAKRAAYQFAVFGDTRTRHDVHQRVVDALAPAQPDFVVHTGDLVADGRKTEQWPIFFRIEREMLRNTVFYPALGNHERNSPEFYQFFDVKQPYYSFQWATAYFIILNSDLGNAAATEEEKQAFWTGQRRWLEEELRKSQSADFRFLAFHHPPFTAVKRRQGANKHVQEWVPLFEKYKVTAVFNGHDHNYQHHLKDGVHYITTGGGGAPLYDVSMPVPGVTQKVESIEHFVIIKVKGRRARAEARALDGRLIDEVVLKRR